MVEGQKERQMPKEIELSFEERRENFLRIEADFNQN